MKTMRMVATKSLKYPAGRYRTRHLVAGEEFEAPRIHALILQTQGKAKPAPHAPLVKVPRMADDPLGRLRHEAERLGVRVDRRWGADRLHREIAQARSE